MGKFKNNLKNFSNNKCSMLSPYKNIVCTYGTDFSSKQMPVVLKIKIKFQLSVHFNHSMYAYKFYYAFYYAFHTIHFRHFI